MSLRGSVALFAAILVAGVFCFKDVAAQDSEESTDNPLTQNPWVDSSQSGDEARPHCGDWEHHLSGTIAGTGAAAGLIAGVRWGKGTITLVNGEEYPFTYKGIKLLDFAAASVEFTGEVYNLSRIEDFIGNYFASVAGIGIAAGEGEVIANNSKCVVIKAKSAGKGVVLSPPGPTGFFVQLAPEE